MAEQTECFARGIKSVGEIFVMNLPSYRIVRNIVYNFQYSIIYTKKNPLFTMKRIKIFLLSFMLYVSIFSKKKKKRKKRKEKEGKKEIYGKNDTGGGENMG